MKKQILSLLSALALVLSLTSTALAYHFETTFPSPIAMSQTHAAYIDGSGGLWTWGRNTRGELGNGSRDSSSIPVKVLDDVSAVSLGNGVSAALKTDQTLWMWGSNYHGQLGTNGTGDADIGGGNNFDHASKHYIHTKPVKVMDNVSYVLAGSYYTAAIKTDGSLWMWGDNQYGHLGNGGKGNKSDRYEYIYQTVPAKIMDNVSYVTFHEDAHATAAIKTDGSLWMWGRNSYGVLGNGGESDNFYEYDELDYKEVYQTTPVKVMDNVSAVRIGANHAAAIKTDGTLWMWGSNYYGQLGDGTTDNASVPIQVMDNVAAVDLGWSRTSALKTDGSLWTWGWNFYGRLGNGTNTDSSVPVKIMEDVAATGGYNDQAAALKTDGSLWTWGWNYYGQLGNGSTASSSVPVQVQTGSAAPPNQNASPFSDVRQDAYYFEPVLWAVDKGITNGVTAVSFAPGAVCTRGEIITFLWRALGKPEPSGTSSTFADVSEKDYFYKPVLWASEQGLAEGDSFSPQAPCTRAQTVEFMWKAAGSPAPVSGAGFSDVPAAYAQAVGWAVEEGIVSGTSPDTFSPDDTCTRGQIVTLLWRNLAK